MKAKSDRRPGRGEYLAQGCLMEEDILKYLEEGRNLEDCWERNPWLRGVPFEEVLNLRSRFISDARQRLPKYRKALSAVLDYLSVKDCGEHCKDLTECLVAHEAIRTIHEYLREGE